MDFSQNNMGDWRPDKCPNCSNPAALHRSIGGMCKSCKFPWPGFPTEALAQAHYNKPQPVVVSPKGLPPGDYTGHMEGNTLVVDNPPPRFIAEDYSGIKARALAMGLKL